MQAERVVAFWVAGRPATAGESTFAMRPHEEDDHGCCRF
jgi:hypothetical protein